MKQQANWREFEPLDYEHLIRGEYAIWWSTEEEPLPRQSIAFQVVDELMRSLHGIETYLLCTLAREFDLADVDDESLRLALPDEANELELHLRGPGEVPLVLLVSRRRGIRFLLHTSQDIASRKRIYGVLLDLVKAQRREILGQNLPIDDFTSGTNPLLWWRDLKEQLDSELEGLAAEEADVKLLHYHIGDADASGTQADLPRTVKSQRPPPPAAVATSDPFAETRPVPRQPEPSTVPKPRQPSEPPQSPQPDQPRREPPPLPEPELPPVARQEKKAKAPPWRWLLLGGAALTVLLIGLSVLVVVLVVKYGQSGESPAAGAESEVTVTEVAPGPELPPSPDPEPSPATAPPEQPSPSSGDVLLSFRLDREIRDLSLASQPRLAVSSGAYAHVVQIDSRERLRRFPAQAVALAADGQRVACQVPDLQVIRIWDIATGQQLHSYRSPKQQVRDFDLGPAGDLLVVLGDELAVVELAQELVLWQGSAASIADVAIASNGETFVLLGDSQLAWHRLRDGRLIERLDLDEAPRRLLQLSDSGARLIFLEGQTLVCLQDRQPLWRQAVPDVLGLALSADGEHLAVVDGTTSLQLRDGATGELLQRVEQVFPLHQVAWATDHTLFLVGQHDVIQWRPAN